MPHKARAASNAIIWAVRDCARLLRTESAMSTRTFIENAKTWHIKKNNFGSLERRPAGVKIIVHANELGQRAETIELFAK